MRAMDLVFTRTRLPVPFVCVVVQTHSSITLKDGKKPSSRS
jgi:hypothetical protein